MTPRPAGRLAEVLGALTLASDLSFGFPPEKAMRTCVLAVELGRRHGLSDEAVRDVYYSGLLTYASSPAFAHEMSALSDGDDIALSNLVVLLDVGSPLELVAAVVAGAGAGRRLSARARGVARVLLEGRRAGERHAFAMCDVANHLARLVGMSEAVCSSLTEICERWDGKGGPRGTAGEALLVPMRVVNLAHVAEIAHHRRGRAAALEVIRRRAGGQLDPGLASTFAREAPALFDAIEGPSIWESFLEAEPIPRARADAARLDDVALAFAGVGDLKSAWTIGHSTGVARLADATGAALGLAAEERALLRRAALLHDIGRLGIPNRVWDKAGALTSSERELVRMHAYWTERVLSQSELLRDVAEVAAAAHERLDGAGYHRAVPLALLGRPARILAAADAYHAMREPRAHRPALDAERAADLLAAEAAAGRLDRAAVDAILAEAGTARRRARASWPCGLSDREVEVLRLLARGGTNKEIAARLGISPRTAQHHVIHIYRKIDRSSRAGAALFATEHGLLEST